MELDMEQIELAAVYFLVSCVIGFLLGKIEQALRRRKKQPESLDDVLFNWSTSDPYTVRNLLNGGVCILGRTGVGKSTSSGKTLMRGIVRYRLSGGLIVAAKNTDADDVREIFRQAGRLDDLYVINPDGELCLNFIDEIRAQGGDAREITRAIMTMGESLRSSDRRGGESSDFWEAETEICLYNAVEALRMGTGNITAPDLQRFIATAPYTQKALTDETWRAGFHNQVMGKAFSNAKTEDEKKDFGMLNDYWNGTFATLAPNTRSCIVTGVLGILHVFNTGIVRTMASGKTNIRPADILDGKWVCINMPPSEWGDSGLLIGSGWRYLVQKAALRRKAKPGDTVVVIWLDEAQQWLNTSFDPHFLAQSRSHLATMCILTQSLHSIFGQARGEDGKQKSLSLLTAFSTKIFHALGSEEDAKYASSLIGDSVQDMISASSGGHHQMLDLMFGKSDYSSSFSEQYQPRVRPHEFMNGLRCGGKENGLICDAWVIKSGESFADGQNFKRVAFSQR
jgi:type IV secretory system conjugative DNA transfer VirD4/TraG family protein